MGGLLAACRSLHVAEGTILTGDQEWDEEIGGVKIHVHPVWRWLLENHRKVLASTSDF